MAIRYKTLNLTQIQTASLRKRPCKLHVDMLAEIPDPAKPLQDFFRALPRLGQAAELLHAADCLAQAALAEKSVVWLLDAQAMEAGLSPLLIRLINRGLIQTIAMTGSAAVRDYELATFGQTQEEIKPGLEDGLLGMSRETGEGMNEIINEGVKRGFSLGEALGRGILDRQPRFYTKSILAACAARMVTITVHVSIGADGFHLHPSADGTALGKGSLKDLQILAARLEGLNEGGVLISAHNSAELQGVFHHALAISKNLGGSINLFSLINFGGPSADFSSVPGITASFRIPGSLELLLPLFTGVVFSQVE